MLTTFTNRGRTIQIGRAPKGGIEFGGKVYRGGQFCPIAALPIRGGAPTQAEAAELFRKCDAVYTVAPWNDRVYLNLEGASKRFRGDMTCKVWIDHKARLVVEAGKGIRTEEFGASLRAVEAFAVEHGIEIRRPR